MAKTTDYVTFLIGVYGIIGIDRDTKVELTGTDQQANVTVFRQTGTLQTLRPSTASNYVLIWSRTYAETGMTCKDHTYLLTALLTLTNGLTYPNSTQVLGPEDGQYCGVDTACPPGSHYDANTKSCVSDTVPPTGPPTIPPTAPETPFPPFTGNPLNPNDWIKWLGEVIRWAVKQIWIELTGIINQVVKLLWFIIPPWMKELIRNWSIIWGSLATWTKDPQQTAFNIVDKLFEEK